MCARSQTSFAWPQAGSSKTVPKPKLPPGEIGALDIVACFRGCISRSTPGGSFGLGVPEHHLGVTCQACKNIGSVCMRRCLADLYRQNGDMFREALRKPHTMILAANNCKYFAALLVWDIYNLWNCIRDSSGHLNIPPKSGSFWWKHY